MTRSKIAICALVVIAGTTGMVEAANFNDGNGKEWRQPGNVGLSWSQVAQACPQDGATSCVGSVAGVNLNDWVWATDAQVLQLFSIFEPAILTSLRLQYRDGLFRQRPVVPVRVRVSADFFGLRNLFLLASVSGWTASKDATGNPLAGSVGWGTTNVSFSGSFKHCRCRQCG